MAAGAATTQARLKQAAGYAGNPECWGQWTDGYGGRWAMLRMREGDWQYALGWQWGDTGEPDEFELPLRGVRWGRPMAGEKA